MAFRAIFLIAAAATALQLPWWMAVAAIIGYAVCSRIDAYLMRNARMTIKYDEAYSWKPDPNDPEWEIREGTKFDRRRTLTEREAILLGRITNIFERQIDPTAADPERP